MNNPIPSFMIDEIVVRENQDTVQFTGKVTAQAPTTPDEVARLQEVTAVQNSITTLRTDLEAAIANIHRETHHDDVNAMVTATTELEGKSIGYRVIPADADISLTGSQFETVTIFDEELMKIHSFREDQVYTYDGTPTGPQPNRGPYSYRLHMYTNEYESDVPIPQGSLLVYLADYWTEAEDYLSARQVSDGWTQWPGRNGEYYKVFSNYSDLHDFILVYETYAEEYSMYPAGTRGYVTFAVSDWGDWEELEVSDFFPNPNPTPDQVLTKHVPYTLGDDGLWVPDAHGVENNDDVLVLTADTALDDDSVAGEAVHYMYSAGKWREVPEGQTIAELIAAIDTVEAGDGLVEAVSGTHSLDTAQLLEGGSVEIPAEHLALSVTTSSFAPVAQGDVTSGQLGSYVVGIDTKLSRKTEETIIHALTFNEARAAGFFLPSLTDYEIDATRLVSSTFVLFGQVSVAGSSWEAQSSVAFADGDNYEFLSGVPPIALDSSSNPSVFSYGDAIADGEYVINDSFSLPMSDFGSDYAVSWSNNAWFKQMITDNFAAGQFIFEVTVPVK